MCLCLILQIIIMFFILKMPYLSHKILFPVTRYDTLLGLLGSEVYGLFKRNIKDIFAKISSR